MKVPEADHWCRRWDSNPHEVALTGFLSPLRSETRADTEGQEETKLRFYRFSVRTIFTSISSSWSLRLWMRGFDAGSSIMSL